MATAWTDMSPQKRQANICLCAALACASLCAAAKGAITWDGGGGDNYWFNIPNWSTTSFLPPTTNGTSTTDTNINMGATVEYDPVNDPYYATAGGLTYPPGYGPTTIWRLYLSSGSTATNTLNIRSGTLTQRDDPNQGTPSAQAIIGRNGVGIVNVYGGAWIQESNNIDLGSNQNTSGAHSGTINYYGGTIEAGLLLAADNSTGGIRLGPATIAGAADPTDGTLRIANTGPDGRICVKNLLVSSGSGNNGSTGLIEFHYGVNTHADGGVRPVQVARSLILNNSASQSSRLDLVLDSPPETPTDNGLFFIPENLGLFDIDYSSTDGWTGTVTGTFYDVTGLTQLTEGSIISAVGPDSYIYRWTLSYTGNIVWSDLDNSLVSSVTGPGTGNDIVLIGLDSTKPVPEPAAITLLGMYSLIAMRRRR